MTRSGAPIWAEKAMRHVMVATDGSEGAARAVDVAAELAKALAGDLVIATAANGSLEDEAIARRMRLDARQGIGRRLIRNRRGFGADT
jgi:nucleotide-binding universal stress UspA family protein